jgi:hypothetical protein
MMWLNNLGCRPVGSMTASKVGFHGSTTQAELPQFPNLSVNMPVPEYLLAMKCMAARAEAESRDFEDVKFLLHRLDFTDPQTVFDLMEHYYPARLIPPRTRYFVEAAFDELKRSQP